LLPQLEASLTPNARKGANWNVLLWMWNRDDPWFRRMREVVM
jgi:hypothetical protein